MYSFLEFSIFWLLEWQNWIVAVKLIRVRMQLRPCTYTVVLGIGALLFFAAPRAPPRGAHFWRCAPSAPLRPCQPWSCVLLTGTASLDSPSLDQDMRAWDALQPTDSGQTPSDPPGRDNGSGSGRSVRARARAHDSPSH
jgi:hypothetical protein